MALQSTKGFRTVPGAATEQSVVVALDNAYPTGGYVLTPKLLGLNVVRRILAIRPATIGSAIYTPVLLPTESGGSITSLLLALVVATTGVQVANGVDVSVARFHIIAEGN